MLDVVHRSVQIEDADSLLSWRNSNEVWRLQQSKGPISPQEHLSWLGSRIEKVNELPFRLYFHGQDHLAFVRIEQFKEGYALSILVSPNFRGKGIGYYVLSDFQSFLLTRFPNRPLYAIIHKDNLASRAIFSRCGFKFHYHVDDEFDEFIYSE